MNRAKPFALIFLVLGLALTACGQPAANALAGGRNAGGSPVQLLAPLSSFVSRVMEAASTPTNGAIREVIRRANQEQQQAFAQSNPALMQGTATADYYAQLTQINQDMKDHGVSAIQLMRLRWGRIAGGAAEWQAVTLETWRTTYSDGTANQSTDLNVYTLVRQNGSWKIQADWHPDGALEVPGPQPIGQPAPGVQPARPSATSGQSLNWAGYQATGGTFTGVTGTWTVPPVSGTAFGADATWVGIGGVETHDLIQAGTEATVTNLGQTQYQAWIETLPQVSHPIPLTTNSGDSITVSINQQAPGRWQVSFKNNTTGQSYQQVLSYRSSGSSAEWIEEAPSSVRGLLPLDNFGTVRFSGASAVKNGRALSAAAAGAQPITMINRADQTVATTSPLGADGSSFSISRAATQPGTGAIALPGGLAGFPFGRVPLGL
ncbi:MAG: hypothetical protein KGJ86_16735 [Chloroflexota bacterium]|nr:hypothetical protein [Chloroflexota bacterium]